MARSTDDDTLEPILPRHPPVAPEPVPPGAEVAGPAGADAVVSSGGRSWERFVLLGCAVVATLALVVCALRLTSIADDQRLQACQARVFAQQQLSAPNARFNAGSDTFRAAMGECLGVDPELRVDDRDEED